MNDSREHGLTEREFKIVGTRPLRPDGVDKVTGRAKFGADLHVANMLIGKVLRSPHAHARIKSIDTSKAQALHGVKAVITARRLQRSAVGVHSGRRDDGQLPRHDAQHDGAREGALRRPRGRGGGGDQRSGGGTGAHADRRRLRSAAARDGRGAGDGARCAVAPRQHVHDRRRAEAGQALQHREARRVRARRHRGRLRQGRRRRRARVHHAAGASGLHRAARVPRERFRGRSGGAVVHDAGTVHRAQLLREAARHGGLASCA